MRRCSSRWTRSRHLGQARPAPEEPAHSRPGRFRELRAVGSRAASSRRRGQSDATSSSVGSRTEADVVEQFAEEPIDGGSSRLARAERPIERGRRLRAHARPAPREGATAITAEERRRRQSDHGRPIGGSARTTAMGARDRRGGASATYPRERSQHPAASGLGTGARLRGAGADLDQRRPTRRRGRRTPGASLLKRARSNNRVSRDTGGPGSGSRPSASRMNSIGVCQGARDTRDRASASSNRR